MEPRWAPPRRKLDCPVPVLWRPVRWWLLRIRVLLPPEDYRGPVNAYRTTWAEMVPDFELATGYSLTRVQGSPAN